MFAGRIGSALDAGVSLYQWNPATQQLDFIDGNDNTLNNTTINGMVPLYNDSLLFAGLTAGMNLWPCRAAATLRNACSTPCQARTGIFDPNFSHSGTNGATVGNYGLEPDGPTG